MYITIKTNFIIFLWYNDIIYYKNFLCIKKLFKTLSCSDWWINWSADKVKSWFDAPYLLITMLCDKQMHLTFLSACVRLTLIASIYYTSCQWRISPFDELWKVVYWAQVRMVQVWTHGTVSFTRVLASKLRQLKVQQELLYQFLEEFKTEEYSFF